ncbi:dispanin subfamily A member 2b-like [Acanthochromis polyacanthus]|nr:dispanin subfamily A member 2b-like [Acanthochromis polyacanthus]
MEGGNTRTAASSYLAWSILNTLFCCLPLGIAAIVYSCKVQNANAVGDSVVATDASRTAKNLNIVSLVCGIILIIILVAVQVTARQH